MTYLRQWATGHKIVAGEEIDRPKNGSDDDVIKMEEIKLGLSVKQQETLDGLDLNQHPGLAFALRGYGNDDMYDKMGWLQILRVLLSEMKTCTKCRVVKRIGEFNKNQRRYKMKTCNKCKVKKELTEFYKRSRSKDGLQSKCKVCSRKQQKKRYYPPICIF